jgi:hypothetical protein
MFKSQHFWGNHLIKFARTNTSETTLLSQFLEVGFRLGPQGIAATIWPTVSPRMMMMIMMSVEQVVD